MALIRFNQLRDAGFSVVDVSAGWKSEVELWAGLAFTTALAVFVVLFLSRVARQRRSSLLAAMLILVAPFVLLSAGLAAYWPSRSLIAQGWYVNVGEVPSFWGVLCGGSVVGVSEFLQWLRAHRIAT
jgi:hypothetical protein